MHRMLHASVHSTQPTLKENGKYDTTLFIADVQMYIIQELSMIKDKFSNKYGEIYLAFDNKDSKYWRCDIYPQYKLNRSSLKDESLIDFDEFYTHMDDFNDMLMVDSPLPSLSVLRCEADDIILVLAYLLGKKEKVLIYSPDKDFIQEQSEDNLVTQYSSKVKAFIDVTTKNKDMQEWLLEHVCLGDTTDNVPRVVDGTVFSPKFKEWCEEKGLAVLEPYEFYEKYGKENATRIFEKFPFFKKNRKGEDTAVLDIFHKASFGAKTLFKQVEKAGSLDAWLDSHPMYRENYELNYKLVMREGIPQDIEDAILDNYLNVDKSFNKNKVDTYLASHGLSGSIVEFGTLFNNLKKPIDASFFDW